MSLLLRECGITITTESPVGDHGDTAKMAMIKLTANTLLSSEGVCGAICDAFSIADPRMLNWDAIDDYLIEFDWAAWSKVIVCVEDARRIFSCNCIDRIIFLKLMSKFSLYWKHRGKEVEVYLVGDMVLARFVQMVVSPWNTSG
ncbi:MAG: hypothetical protein U5J83_17725 [Bryobacterales bacterium]|nr:hypothetical protein [Bryobacterales bacterium]